MVNDSVEQPKDGTPYHRITVTGKAACQIRPARCMMEDNSGCPLCLKAELERP